MTMALIVMKLFTNLWLLVGGSTSESPAVISRIAAGRTQYGCTLSRLIQATMKAFWIIA